MALVSLPHTLVAGTPENVNHVQANDEALRDGVNNIEDANIGTPLTGASILDSTITDTELASPNNGVYRRLAYGSTAVAGGTGLATYWVTNNGTAVVSPLFASTPIPPLVYLDTAEQAVTGKSTVLNIRFQTLMSNTAHSGAMTAGLYPVTGLTASASGVAYIAGAVVAGSTAAVVTAGADSLNTVTSGDFATPATGRYLLGYTITGFATAGSSYCHTHIELRVRNT